MGRRRYRSQKVHITDADTEQVFDSKLEARRYLFLKHKQEEGRIKNLQTQVAFEVIPATPMSRKTDYIADFVYDEIREYKGKKFKVRIVEDSKGVQQDVFKIKHKLMLWKFMREGLPWIFRITYDFEGKNFEDTFVTDNPLIVESEDTMNPENYYYISSSGTTYPPDHPTFKKAWRKDINGEGVPGIWLWKY